LRSTSAHISGSCASAASATSERIRDTMVATRSSIDATKRAQTAAMASSISLVTPASTLHTLRQV
jgi:hypothetical protein